MYDIYTHIYGSFTAYVTWGKITSPCVSYADVGAMKGMDRIYYIAETNTPPPQKKKK